MLHTNKTIVWIDDDIAIIDPVVHPLERAGYHILRIESVKEALNALDAIRNADLILLSMTLPHGRDYDVELQFPFWGMQLLYELRKHYDVMTPVIAFTGMDSPEIRRQLRRLGVAEIVHKPVRPSELKAQVEKVLAAVPKPKQ